MFMLAERRCLIQYPEQHWLNIQNKGHFLNAHRLLRGLHNTFLWLFHIYHIPCNNNSNSSRHSLYSLVCFAHTLTIFYLLSPSTKWEERNIMAFVSHDEMGCPVSPCLGLFTLSKDQTGEKQMSSDFPLTPVTHGISFHFSWIKIITCNLKLRRHDELFSLRRYKDWTCLCLAWFPPEKTQSTLVFFKFQVVISTFKVF